MSYVKGSQLPSVTTVADTDTLIVTQEGDSKATKKATKSDLLKEDRTRLTNLETDNTTNKSNITNLQNSLDNKAEKTHNHTIKDVTNLQTTLDSKAPINYVSQFEGGAISSNFRKTIIGTTDMCGFAKSFRKNDSTDACMPQNGSGIAWGQADTHGMLYVDWGSSTAYVAGGNGNKLNWYKQIAWKDDLANYSLTTHNHDTVYSKLDHTHNYAGSSTAGGPATSAITAKYPGITWTATTQVGTWSALCKTTRYVSFILSITTNNGEQCGFDTFIVSTGYKSGIINQLGGNGYKNNSGYQLRLVKEDIGTQYTLEIKNDYSYDGATTSNIECRYIVTSNHDYITTYSGAFVASTNNDVVYSITTSPNYMVGTISNALKDSEGNIIKDTYVKKDEKDITVLFERNNGTINKNINTCFNNSSGNFTAPEAGQYLVMCSGYELSSSSSEYVACVLDSSSSNQNKLYTTGSSGFTLITLNEGQTLAIYTATAGNMNKTCISSNSAVNMLIARIK